MVRVVGHRDLVVWWLIELMLKTVIIVSRILRDERSLQICVKHVMSLCVDFTGLGHQTRKELHHVNIQSPAPHGSLTQFNRRVSILYATHASREDYLFAKKFRKHPTAP